MMLEVSLRPLPARLGATMIEWGDVGKISMNTLPPRVDLILRPGGQLFWRSLGHPERGLCSNPELPLNPLIAC